MHAAAESFNYKTFFKACGLAAKSAEEVKKAFFIIDQDQSGFIEEDELKYDSFFSHLKFLGYYTISQCEIALL